MNTWSFLQSPTFTCSKKPKEGMNAFVDVLLTVLKGYFVAAACSILVISNADEVPKKCPTLHTDKSKMNFIAKLSRQVVGQCSIISEAILWEPVTPTMDSVYNYARVFCHYAYEFRDAWEHR